MMQALVEVAMKIKNKEELEKNDCHAKNFLMEGGL